MRSIHLSKTTKRSVIIPFLNPEMHLIQAVGVNNSCCIQPGKLFILMVEHHKTSFLFFNSHLHFTLLFPGCSSFLWKFLRQKLCWKCYRCQVYRMSESVSKHKMHFAQLLLSVMTAFFSEWIKIQTGYFNFMMTALYNCDKSKKVHATNFSKNVLSV